MSDIPLEQFLADDPPSADINTLLIQARELVVEGDRTKAFDLVCQALKQDMKNADALYLYANLTPDTQKALAALRNLLQIDPQHERANALLEKLHRQQNQVTVVEKSKNDQWMQPSRPAQQDVLLQQLLVQQQMLEEQRRQPVINITNAPVNNNVATVTTVELEGRNQLAFWVGLLVGIFFLTFGFAHFMTGKIGTGIVHLLAGWIVWGSIAAVIITMTVGSGLCLVVPLHIALAYASANSGAKVRRYQNVY